MHTGVDVITLMRRITFHNSNECDECNSSSIQRTHALSYRAK